MGPRALPVLFLALAACAAPAPVAAPAVPQDRAPAPWDGGWSPPEDLLDEARLLGSDDPAVRAAAGERLAALPDADRVRLLRAGLRLPDGPAAVACAKRMRWEWLDDGESGRCVDLLTPHLGEPDTMEWFDEYRSYLGSDDFAVVLERLPGLVEKYPGFGEWKHVLGHLHRIVRAGHFPALARLTSHPDSAIRDGAWGCIAVTVPNTDRHRDAIAGALLRWARDNDDVRSTGPGYSPLLREVLISFYLEGNAHETYEEWAFRWMAEETPAEADLPILRAMLEDPELPEPGTVAAIRALGTLDHPGAVRAIAEVLGDPRATRWNRMFATEALARWGGKRAGKALAAEAAEDPLAFALLGEVDPAAAVAIVRDGIADGDLAPERTDAVLNRAANAREEALRYGIRWPGLEFRRMAEGELPERWDGVTLARLAAKVPECATRTLAEEAAARLRRHPPRNAFFLPPDGSPGEMARLPERATEGAFLEVAAPDGFREMLREWIRLEPEEFSRAREWALTGTLLLGDSDSGPVLAEWVRENTTGEPRGSPDPWAFQEWETATFLLSRSPCAEIRSFLEESAREFDPGADTEAWGAFAALGALDGLPEWTARWVGGKATDAEWTEGTTMEISKEPVPGEAAAGARRLLLAGRPLDALALVLEFERDDFSEDLGLVDDERVRAHLISLQERRERGRYREATEQLAIGGDPEALAELWSVWRNGRYRWIDSADEWALPLGRDLSTIPFWLGELEASCCRNYKPAWVLGWLFDADTRDLDPGLVGKTERTRRWWEEFGGRMKWSRLADRYVIGAGE